jgi:plastocyanin domain-containing protein
MTLAQIVITVGGLLLIAGIVWFFWLKKIVGVKAPVTSTGYQELTILVKNGYVPSVVRVEAGTPVRLTFRREETNPCSENVVFDAFGKHATLPEGQLVPIEFLPKQRGEYPFTCAMGMLRGMVVVE